MVVRISKGHFDPPRAAEVERLLRESEATLRPALRALPGLRAYHVGLDAAASAMTNTSLWDTRDQAMQMASLQAMRDLATTAANWPSARSRTCSSCRGAWCRRRRSTRGCWPESREGSCWKCAAGIGVPAQEVPLKDADLFGADEAFLTSSTKDIVPIVQVDQKTIGTGQPGPVTMRLLEEYRRRAGVMTEQA